MKVDHGALHMYIERYRPCYPHKREHDADKGFNSASGRRENLTLPAAGVLSWLGSPWGS